MFGWADEQVKEDEDHVVVGVKLDPPCRLDPETGITFWGKSCKILNSALASGPHTTWEKVGKKFFTF